MKISSSLQWFAWMSVVALTIVFAGCGTLPQDDPCAHATYDGKTGMVPYTDAARGFRLCLPKGLTRTGPDGSAGGRVVFTGFAVPSGTNLESKTLVIVSGKYDETEGATAFGTFMAGGVTFKRVKLDEGSAGHSDLHVIYTWKQNGKAPLHFDFTHHSVNPGVFDPGNRPAEYDRAAQVKLTEAVMRTFVRM